MHRRLHQISGHGSRADRGALLVLLPLLIAVVHTIALSTKPVPALTLEMSPEEGLPGLHANAGS